MISSLFRVKLTGGNVRNFHFYLRDCLDVIPAGGIGGKNRGSQGEAFTVRFEPGTTVETDVDGDKLIFRNRKAVRAFFESSAASEGDVVVIEKSGDRSLTVWLERAT